MCIKIQSPGKLYIAGEYAITTANHLAIIAPVPRYLTVELIESDDNYISSSQQPGFVLEWLRECGAIVPLDNNPFPIITKTIEMVELYISALNLPLKNFELEINSQLDDTKSGQKYGFGSSAAVTVATIKAMLTYHDIPFDNWLVFKLACLTHIALDSNGSFGDLAVSTFDEWIIYRSLDKAWLVEQLENHTLLEILALDWQALKIEPLPKPQSCRFLVGWSGSPASSEKLVSDIATIKNSAHYTVFLADSNTCVNDLMTGFKTNDYEKIAKNLTKNRQLLQQLSPQIETETLRKLCDIAEKHNSVAKVSGAGGGDCGIALVTSKQQETMIATEWQQQGILPILTLGGTYE